MRGIAGLILSIVCCVKLSCDGRDSKVAQTSATIKGLDYKIITDGFGDKAKQGEYLKLQVKQIYNDSILSDTRQSFPQYQAVDSSQMTPDAYSVFTQVRSGDSVIFKVPGDSAFVHSKPSFFKGGGWLYTYLKVEALFRGEAEMQADMEVEKAKRKKLSGYEGQ